MDEPGEIQEEKEEIKVYRDCFTELLKTEAGGIKEQKRTAEVVEYVIQ